MSRLKKILIGVCIFLVLCIIGIILFKVFYKEKPDPKNELSGTVVNNEELSIYGEEAYNNTLKYMFSNSSDSEKMLFSDGYTVLYKDHIPIIMKPKVEEKNIEGVYDFEKSLQRKYIEKECNVSYTGNIENDITSVLNLFTGTGSGDKKNPDFDYSDAPNIEGLNTFNSITPSAIAITDSVKFKKGKLSIKFHTVDTEDPDGSIAKEAEENGETFVSSSGYNESAAAYTYCEESIGYILLFPEYIEKIKEISIKGENFAPMHVNTDTMTCKYAMTEGNLYETWAGFLIEGDIEPVTDTVYIPLEVTDPKEAERLSKIEEKRSVKEDTLFTESSEEVEDKASTYTPIEEGIPVNIIIIAIIGIILLIIYLIGQWFLFSKTGLPGWISLVPVLNLWALFEMTWGEGIKCLLLLIPVYNIIVVIKTELKLARVFGRSTLFGIGLILLNPIFLTILGFSKSEYLGIDE